MKPSSSSESSTTRSQTSIPATLAVSVTTPQEASALKLAVRVTVPPGPRGVLVIHENQHLPVPGGSTGIPVEVPEKLGSPLWNPR